MELVIIFGGPMNPIFEAGSFKIYPVENKDGTFDKNRLIFDMGGGTIVLELREILTMGESMLGFLRTLRQPNVFSN
jgi:hypothetical protein